MSVEETGSGDPNRARAHWDQAAAARELGGHRGWLDSSIVLSEIVLPRVSGSGTKHWLVGLCERIGLARDLRWLSLGCGAAGQEMLAARNGLFASMEAVDISQVSLEIARASAEAQGIANIEFREGDLNRISLPEAKFDVVLMNMSLHHVEKLERLLDEVHRTLVPGGWFLAHEYVGPRQFQFPDQQLRIVERLLATLPERFRLDSTTGEIKREYIRRPPSWWAQADPSEAIRSDRILSEIERRFDVVDRRDYGGAVLHLLLEHIVQNFDASRIEDVCWIRLLGEAEALLQENGVIQSDFVLLGGKKRAAAGPGRASWVRRAARLFGMAK